uniref:Oxysterol-binding protein n=1 Tax=Neogobius melanostomus TaxID=47308 RepID=A0A8C6SZY2_9GOBI
LSLQERTHSGLSQLSVLYPQDSWEIVEGLRGGYNIVQEPHKQEGYMLKRRKWPMKGWHKRYFLLDKGILKYGKCSADIEKGKLHGCIDVGLSVMAIKQKAKCIDLDAEENIYHLKVNHKDATGLTQCSRLDRSKQKSYWSFMVILTLSYSAGCNSQAKVAAWLQSSDDMDKCSKDLSVCEAYLLELSHLLQSMEVLHRTYSAPSIQALQACTFESPKKEKRLPRKWRTKNYNKEVPSCISSGSIRLHASNPNLSTAALSNEKGDPESECPIDVAKLQEDFCRVATNLHTTMKSALTSLTSERERLRQCVEFETCPPTSPQKQESVDESHHLVHQVSNESRASIAESLSEFFDAHEVLVSASSSENEVSALLLHQNGTVRHQRRTCLPSPSPNNSTISLWNILRNNIGKDLSKVAMPVHLNEPLNTLQRLCEELEYSELLDLAASTQDPFQRMVYIATFIVSGYASSYYRTGGKPFNPVLGETYECDRPDRGFRFLAEQVSHHPPISACHAESKNFIFWQDLRCKNKFWGKSMEIVPIGKTHVTLPGFGDHYEWNKVTSCVHNILSGQRWIEHYGEISIRNTSSNVCQCKITFVKAKYWNSCVNEVEGTITDQKGKVVHRLFGKWHEAVYCGDPPSATCSIPVDYQKYYGFTKFAIELNELHPSLKLLLPPTDTRLRVDQRLLEEGKLEEAEEQKQRIEEMQREQRKILEENHVAHQPRFFGKSKDDTWVSNNTYWELRADPGFAHIDFPALW